MVAGADDSAAAAAASTAPPGGKGAGGLSEIAAASPATAARPPLALPRDGVAASARVAAVGGGGSAPPASSHCRCRRSRRIDARCDSCIAARTSAASECATPWKYMPSTLAHRCPSATMSLAGAASRSGHADEGSSPPGRIKHGRGAPLAPPGSAVAEAAPPASKSPAAPPLAVAAAANVSTGCASYAPLRTAPVHAAYDAMAADDEAHEKGGGGGGGGECALPSSAVDRRRRWWWEAWGQAPPGAACTPAARCPLEYLAISAEMTLAATGSSSLAACSSLSPAWRAAARRGWGGRAAAPTAASSRRRGVALCTRPPGRGLPPRLGGLPPPRPRARRADDP